MEISKDGDRDRQKDVVTDFLMDISGFQLAEEARGDSSDDTLSLRQMAADARKYLRSHKWCPTIKKLYLADGVGGIVAIFLAELSEPIQGQDTYLWVIVGDLPSAYLVVEDLTTPLQALFEYCSLMEKWADAVLSGKTLDNLFPVAEAPTEENARNLKRRITFIRDQILPELS